MPTVKSHRRVSIRGREHSVREYNRKRSVLIKNFDAELSSIIKKYKKKSDKLGGEFLSPGIDFELQKLMKRKSEIEVK